MSQNISVRIVDENNQIIKLTNLNLSLFIHEFSTRVKDKEKYKMILCIDPYGKTLFNKQQISYLKKDLFLLKESNLVLDCTDTIDNLLGVCDSIEIHDYLLFVGD